MIKTIPLYLLLLAVLPAAKGQTQRLPVTNAAPNENFNSFTGEKLYNNTAFLQTITPVAYRANPDFGKFIIGKSFEDSTYWYEQLDKRTLTTRTYVDANHPDRVLTESARENINYLDENGWYRAANAKLKPTVNGWGAPEQEVPTYLYKDASTALSIGNNQLMVFNKNVKFNTTTISTNNYSVGDNGTYIKNVATNTDKIIRFGRGRIETDYLINQPLNLKNDLSISEDIELSKGYTIVREESFLAVKDANSKTVAQIQYPYCYDKTKASITGTYKLTAQSNGYRLELEVPAEWLNSHERQYPVTIDPPVQGVIAEWDRGRIGSCLDAINDTVHLPVMVPADITITGFYIQSVIRCYSQPTTKGQMSFWTPCNDTLSSDTGTQNATGYLGVAPFYNFLSGAPSFSCCFTPSCSSYTIPLCFAVLRFAGNAGCDTTEIYYDPIDNQGYPFEAYVVGRTVEATYAVPQLLCGNLCTISLTTTANYGVPPYKITHPWFAGSTTFGNYSLDSCNSTGSQTINLSIPGCTGANQSDTSLVVPPPVIVDACNDTVKGLMKTLIPTVAAPNVPTITVSVTGDSLISSATSDNQWYFDNQILTDSTRQVLIIKGHAKGWYYVVVSNPANGCSTTSDSTSSINRLSEMGMELSLYPNPFNATFILKISSSVANINDWALRITDVLGRTIYTDPSLNYNNEINLDDRANGVYFISVSNGSDRTVLPVIKQ